MIGGDGQVGVVVKDSLLRSPTRPRVHIVDFHDTSAAASNIIRGLAGLDIDGSAPFPDKPGQVQAVVVLLSTAALRDPSWASRVESLRVERLVPVSVGTLADSDVPEFLRELNWIFYRPDDASFLAKLFTGINTDASRFRDNRDTRALAERWEKADRSPDFLIDSLREVKRRIGNAAADVGNDPLIPEEQVDQLAGSFRHRYRLVYDPISETTARQGLPPWITRLIALWLATFPGVLDKILTEEGTTPVAFLSASRRHATRLMRRRIRRISFRTVIAVVTVVAVAATVVLVQQAVKKSNNAVSFSVGDIAFNGRPDLSAIKAAASLIDSGSYPGDDGRFRIVTDSLSQHWATGYLTADGSALQSAVFLADGSIQAADFDGGIWTWDSSLSSRTRVATGVAGATAFDASPGGDLAVVGDRTTVNIALGGSVVGTVDGFGSIKGFRLAPANHRLLVSASGALWVVDGIGPNPQRPKKLGEWDSVMDVVQTTDGHAAALVKRDGLIEIVHDDGTVDGVMKAPGDASLGALAPDGRSFALNIEGTIWTSTGGPMTSSGILVPGVATTMSMTSDGLVLVSDRTLGSWVADPKLGIRIGAICDGLLGTTSIAVDPGGRTLCVNSNITVDSIADLRPAGFTASVPAPTLAATSSGQVASVSLVKDLILLKRARGDVIGLDPAGLSFAPDFEQPIDIANANFFATGALIQARSLPTTVAVTEDGNTLAIGFVDGRLIEVDLDAQGFMAPVGSWQLPDHEAVRSITWSADDTIITATTERGTQWERFSCAGCWKDRRFVDHITDRAWLCYDKGDIDELGDTPRKAFSLRECQSRWGGDK